MEHAERSVTAHADQTSHTAATRFLARAARVIVVNREHRLHGLTALLDWARPVQHVAPAYLATGVDNELPGSVMGHIVKLQACYDVTYRLQAALTDVRPLPRPVRSLAPFATPCALLPLALALAAFRVALPFTVK